MRFMGRTPGIWWYNLDFSEVQAEGGARTLARMEPRDDYSEFAGETNANGYLMAAAPDLLEACKAMVSWLSDHCVIDCDVYEQIQAALRKAEPA